jgi:CIC family chloride channel protein
VVGMAALLTAVTRTSITSIAVVIEMTAGSSMLPPMLTACFAAMLVSTPMRDAPPHDSMRERTLRIQQCDKRIECGRRIRAW